MTNTYAVPDSVVVSSRDVGWNGILVEQHRLDPGEITARPTDVHRVSIHLGASHPLWQERAGRSRHELHRAGDVIVVAAGETAWLRWDRTTTFLRMTLDAQWMRGIAETLDRAVAPIEGDFAARDPRIEHLGLALLNELEADAPNGILYGDAIATALAVHLLGRRATGPTRAMSPTPGLPAAELRRVTDYIHDRLSEPISLAELARIARLSPYHFARQFRLSLGVAPHQYVVRARVDEARRLLIAGQHGVAAAAAQVGFASQSHLSRHMRRLLGVTPGVFTKERRGS